MSTHDKDLHACVLAALILHDGNIPITGAKIKTLLDASNNHDVALVYCNMIAKFLEGKDVSDLLLTQVQACPQQQPHAPVTDKGGIPGGQEPSDGCSDFDICCASDEDDLFGVSLFD